MTTITGAGVRTTNSKEDESVGNPTPAPHDGEYWRQKGYELVMRYGSVKERAQAKRRLQAVMEIRENAARAWLAERNREAA